ncbi:hypothetical protein D3C71_1141690 [compost metagenome]
MDKLTIAVAEKMGVSADNLMASIHSSMDAKLTMLYIIGIVTTITTLIIAAWMSDYTGVVVNRKKKINFGVMSIGIILFLIAIYRSVAYQNIYMTQLLELAHKVGVM